MIDPSPADLRLLMTEPAGEGEAEASDRTLAKSHTELKVGLNEELDHAALLVFDRGNPRYFEGVLERPDRFDWHYRGKFGDCLIHHVLNDDGSVSNSVEFRIPAFKLEPAQPEHLVWDVMIAMTTEWVQSTPTHNGRGACAGSAKWWNKLKSFGLAGPRPGVYCKKISNAMLQVGLQPVGDNANAAKLVTFFHELVDDGFALPVMVPDKADVPDPETGETPREIHSRSRITLYCPQCRARGYGKPGSSFLCERCSPPNPSNVKLEPLTEEARLRVRGAALSRPLRRVS
jgi:hypothetical protein